MGRRAARLVLVLGVSACALGAAGQRVGSASAADDRRSELVRGAVGADGGAGDGWSVGHPDDGRYLVVIDGAAGLSVTSWEGVATVEVTPVAEEVALVALTSPSGAPVDGGFTFTVRR